ncbi:phage regulatory protein/antirepressor Ant [Tissierella praeacuta]|uniref:phage regulatory protein/antirepressor Ant n=1 Tax=Tissierella praeacuta TaxID=43131 RepID=UPI003342878D
MSNLINITNQNGQLVVSSREVARDFEKEHAKVTRDIENLIEGIAKNGDTYNHLFIDSKYQNEQNKQWYKEYLLTRDGFSLLVMGFTGKKALTWKLKYIEAFNKMEQALKEQEKPLKLDSKFMYQIAQELEEKEKQIALMAPKAVFANAVAASRTSILIGELAKLLNQNGIDMGQNRLFEWLRREGFLIKRKGTDYNMPTQKSMNLELFEIKETSITHSDGHISISKTSKVTGKGQIYFVNKFKEMQLEQVI